MASSRYHALRRSVNMPLALRGMNQERVSLTGADRLHHALKRTFGHLPGAIPSSIVERNGTAADRASLVSSGRLVLVDGGFRLA